MGPQERGKKESKGFFHRSGWLVLGLPGGRENKAVFRTLLGHKTSGLILPDNKGE